MILMNLHFLGACVQLSCKLQTLNSCRFLRNEILASEKLPGNISILTAITSFFGGIAAARTWGELMVPA